MTEKILTQHPQGKKGVNIDKAKYDLVRSGIMTVLEREIKMKPMNLFESVAVELQGQMDGSIAWYAVSVKLDMEARGLITHDRKKGLLWLSNQGSN